jgi:hypothetical protein
MIDIVNSALKEHTQTIQPMDFANLVHLEHFHPLVLVNALNVQLVNIHLLQEVVNVLNVQLELIHPQLEQLKLQHVKLVRQD